MPARVVGLKLLRDDGGSLNDKYGRVIYPVGEWVAVPGNGAYVAISGGLKAGGTGPLLAAFECEQPRSADAGEGMPAGVTCFRRVRRLATLPSGLTFRGGLDLRGTPITELPEGLHVGGWLDLRDTQITELPEGLQDVGVYR